MNIGMTRLGTWLVVAAIGLLGLVAAVDALRGTDSSPPAAEEPARTDRGTTAPEETDTAGPQEQLRRLAARELAEDDIEGTLLLTDINCRIRSVELPTLEERDAPVGNGCRLNVSPASRLVGADGTVYGPDDYKAQCTDHGVEVAHPVSRAVPGVCPPAWTPDGRLTVVARGELRQVDLGCKAGDLTCTTVLLGDEDVVRAMGGLPWQMGSPTIREAAWLGNDRVALVVHDGAQNLDALAVFRGRELLGAPPFLYESLSGLRTSPRGGHASALLNGGALVLVDGNGEYEPRPFPGATGIAWSPDERWTATASPEGIFIFGTGTRGGVAPVFVPIQATDLVWIGP